MIEKSHFLKIRLSEHKANGGMQSVTVIIRENRIREQSSKPGHFTLHQCPWKKTWINLFSSQLCVNRRADWVLESWLGNQSRRKTSFTPLEDWPCVTSCQGRVNTNNSWFHGMSIHIGLFNTDVTLFFASSYMLSNNMIIIIG